MALTVDAWARVWAKADTQERVRIVLSEAHKRGEMLDCIHGLLRWSGAADAHWDPNPPPPPPRPKRKLPDPRAAKPEHL